MGTVAQVRVVLAEDNLLVREGLRAVLTDERDVEVVAVCARLDELLAAVDVHEPGLVLTDIRMPPTLTEVARGRSNAAIAAQFGISTRAVEKHVSSIFTKLDLLDDSDTHRRVKAALLALRHRAS